MIRGGYILYRNILSTRKVFGTARPVRNIYDRTVLFVYVFFLFFFSLFTLKIYIQNGGDRCLT